MALAEQDNNTETIEDAPVVTVTDTAAGIIRKLLQEREIPNYVLRVFVAGGGCSGMQYGMRFEEAPQEFDKVVEVDGVRLVIDPTSMMYLQGAVIDYVDNLILNLFTSAVKRNYVEYLKTLSLGLIAKCTLMRIAKTNKIAALGDHMISYALEAELSNKLSLAHGQLVYIGSILMAKFF